MYPVSYTHLYDGQEAIKVLDSTEVDLLIIDVMMPKLDGIRATLKIREKNSLPIIILSAKSDVYKRQGHTEIHAIEWRGEGQMKAVLQVCHGMVEYIERRCV